MPKNFTFKQSKDLVQEFYDLLHNVYKARTRYNAIADDVVSDVDYLTYSHTFDNLLQSDFEQGVVQPTDFVKLKHLFTLLYSYIEAKRYSTYFTKVYSDNQDKIYNLTADLSLAKNQVKWLFLSPLNKQKMEDAYLQLNERKDSPFFVNVKKALAQLDALTTTDFATVKQAFEHDRQAFYSALQAIYPKILFGNTPDFLQKLFDRYESLQQVLDKIDDIQQSRSGIVEKSIDKLLDEQLIETLRKIPTEELSRGQGGIRIKTLVDAGYTSIADTYLATTGRLERIYGISWEMAENIRDVSVGFAEEMKKGLKLKLSVDNKSKASTELVKDIFRLRQSKKALILLEQQQNNHSDDLHDAVGCLEQLGTGRMYFLEDEETKQEAVDSYTLLKNHLWGNYAEVVQSACNQLDDYVYVNADSAWADFEQNTVAYFNLIEELRPDVIGNDDQLYGLPEELAQQIQEVPVALQGLTCELRRYQEWGVKYILHQERVLLGDEMGLGKTVQAIAAMVALANTGETHFVVVCPASVLTNWCREIAKHSTLKAIKVHGAHRAEALDRWLACGGVAVTTYETTRHFKLSQGSKLSMLVLDEAHYIKNPNAQRTVNCKRLCKHAPRLLFMTGTPLENKVDEMISLISVLDPALAKELKTIAFMSTAEQFKNRVASVYYRRKRDDVLTELPELIETKEWCEMGAIERKAYEHAILHGTYPEARRLSWHVSEVDKHSSKAIRLAEIVEEAEAEGRKVLVFSFFLDTINKVAGLFDGQCCEPITGAVPPARRQQIIDDFNNAPAGQVLVAQILSGGTGLNIQSASVVVICEPQLKPSIENQAISRAYRMGQARNVLVYRLLCEDTIDERITKMLEDKQTVFDTFADESAAAEKDVEIDEQTLGEIIKDEIARINGQKGNSFDHFDTNWDDAFGN